MAVPPRQVHFTRLNQDKPFSSKGTVPALPGPGAVVGRAAGAVAGNLRPRLRVTGSAPARPRRFKITTRPSPPEAAAAPPPARRFRLRPRSARRRNRRGSRGELRWLATASNRCSGNDFVAGTMGRGLVAACASCVLARRGPRGRSMRTARARDAGWGACGWRLSLRRVLSLVLQLGAEARGGLLHEKGSVLGLLSEA